MNRALYHDETPMSADRPCPDCSQIGVSTVCLRQLEDAKNPSCLEHVLQLPQDGSSQTARWQHFSEPLEVWSADSSKSRLLRRSKDGCHLCKAFLEADWGEFAHADHDAKVSLHLLKHQESPTSSSTYKLTFGHVQGGFGVCAEPAQKHATLSQSTGSRASLNRIKDLLVSCHGHEACEKRWAWQNEKRRLPTRLVDLGMVAQTGTISVCEGKALPVSTTYMTLSHCWGPAKRPTDAPWLSHEKLRQGIPLICLPPTFRDACLAILDLGCSYVWIDALCILQGDEADWLRESERMSEVFSMSALTIAGSGSGSTSAGLFWRRESPSNLSQICAKFSCSCKESVLAGYNADANYWCRPRQHMLPLHSRAWVLQEMALSTRVAYFTATGIYWVCEETEGSELRQARRKTDYTLAVPGSIKPNPPSDSYSWIMIIQEYSNLDLSFDKDRLAALSGLARRCDAGSNGKMGRYCAGLWESHLHEHLAWQPAGSVQDLMARRPSTYPPPSWSWASINTPVMWESITLTRPCFEVVEIEMNPVLDAYGVVNGGRLRLKTPLVPFRIHVDVVGEEIPTLPESEGDPRVYDRAGNRIYPTLEQVSKGVVELFANVLYLYADQADLAISESGSEPMQATATTRLRGGHKANLIFDDPAILTGPKPVQSQPMMVMPINRAEKVFPYGLLLEPVAGQRGTYRRIGLTHFYMPRNVYTAWVKKVRQPISDELHLGRQPDGRYLVDLI